MKQIEMVKNIRDSRMKESQIYENIKLGLPIPKGYWIVKDKKLYCSIQPTVRDLEQIEKLRWKGFRAGDIFND